MTIKLYTYWRSSAAYRVRIALNLKGLAYDAVPVSLAPGEAEHRKDEYRACLLYTSDAADDASSV